MAKPNYRFDKRQRELRKAQRQEEKRLNKLSRAAGVTAESPKPDGGEPRPAAEKK